MGVMSRANSKLPPTLGGGEYLEKDDLVRDQNPMAIANVVFDSTGSSFGPRWVVSVEPWYEGQDDPQGLLTFTNNPTRQPVFEDLQAQIEESGEQRIGPVTLIRAKTQKGYRFYTFADFVEQDSNVVAMPVPEVPTSTRQVETRVLPSGEIKRRPGRPKGSTNRPKGSVQTPTVSTSSTSAPEIPATRPPAAGEAAKAQSVVTPVYGAVMCPNCQQAVQGRILSDENGARVIIHAQCPVTKKAEILFVTDEEA
jgi:hypothetical protein